MLKAYRTEQEQIVDMKHNFRLQQCTQFQTTLHVPDVSEPICNVLFFGILSVRVYSILAF